MVDAVYRLAAQELLRKIRGRRSQVWVSRRLGYRGNPITDWEHGRRAPTIKETLRLCALTGVDSHAAFVELVPSFAGWECGIATTDQIAAWLDALRGSSSLTQIAERAGCSRSSVSRYLSGQSEPRLPEFLLLVDAITGRVPDWAHALIGIEHVPSLARRHEHVALARDIALREPWTEVLLRVLETQRGRSAPDPAAYAAELLGLEVSQVRALLQALIDLKIVQLKEGRPVVTGELNVDVASNPERLNTVRRHWADVARGRLQTHPPEDWFAYNVIAVSRKDSERIEQRMRAAYREVRAIVARSGPEEVAALLTIHLVRFQT